MTMKTKKTLQHIAAVAVVLLTLSLVFTVPVSATEGVTTDQTAAVAKIGETYYTSLQAAIADAESNKETTIILLKDVTNGNGVVIGGGPSYLCDCQMVGNSVPHTTECAKVTVPENQNIIIDLNGKTYTASTGIGSSGTTTIAFQILKNSDVTIKNGTITSSGDNVKRLIQNYADLTLTDVELNGSNLPDGIKYVLSFCCGDSIINEGTKIITKSGDYAFDVYHYGFGGYTEGVSVTVNGGNIGGKVEVAADSYTPITKHQFIVNGGTFTDPTVLNYLGEGAKVTVNLAKDVTVSEPITVSKGAVTLDLGTHELSAASGKSVITLNGGSLTLDGNEGKIYSNNDPIVVKSGTLTVNSGVTVETDVWNNMAAIYVSGVPESAEIAITVNDGATLKGNKGIAIGNYASVEDKPQITVTFAGSAICYDTLITHNGKNRDTTTYPTITIKSKAKLSGVREDLAPFNVIYAAGYADWKIEGGEFKADTPLSIKSGKFTITGGKFTATGTNTVPPSGNDNGPELTGAALSITSNDDFAGEIEVTVNGGEFISQNGHAVYEGIANGEAVNSKVKSISINGGSFSSGKDTETGDILDVVRIVKATNKKVVSGGIFNKEVDADYIADGKFSVVNIDDGKETYPYAVGDKKYAFSVDNAEIGFDSVKVGYTQPAAKEVTVTNTGNLPVTLTAPVTSDKYIIGKLPTIQPGQSATFTIQPVAGLAVGNYAETITVTTNEGAETTFKVSFLVYQPSSGGSSKPVEEPEEPVEPEVPVEPETPTEEPEAGEATVETEVTDGGEVLFEAPVEPETPGADTPSDEPAEPTVTGVELPAGTDSEVAFIPVSEKPAPAGKEQNTKKVFEINVPKYEKGKPATVKFTMTVAELAADGKTAADVALWHQDEETGEWTKLVTTFVIIDGVVYFEAITFDFSPFAIVYEDVSAPTEPETPEQPTESPAPILAVLAGIGAAVVLRRK